MMKITLLLSLFSYCWNIWNVWCPDTSGHFAWRWSSDRRSLRQGSPVKLRSSKLWSLCLNTIKPSMRRYVRSGFFSSNMRNACLSYLAHFWLFTLGISVFSWHHLAVFNLCHYNVFSCLLTACWFVTSAPVCDITTAPVIHSSSPLKAFSYKAYLTACCSRE